MIPRLALTCLCLLLGACSLLKPREAQTEAAPAVIVPQVITAVGFGAPPAAKELSPAQRKLAAMRASKLDAYRGLMETVSGVRLSSQSTVGMMVLGDDRMRVFVDGYLRGARVVSVKESSDGSFTTTLSLTLAPSFVAALAGGELREEAPPAADPDSAIVSLVTPAPAPAASDQAAVEVVPDRSPTSNFYYAQ
ncbi:LPP20 family lipoprotein [Chitinolyticbacter albus]|uniref:LPP20 family lipoprotein n=1 Tax=Chitinolyticbacter albus TaxID=2961951 RepID=UPI00210B00A4|nr:LPP20 family lipoprotein [Chitinolyticbacter albus]